LLTFNFYFDFFNAAQDNIYFIYSFSFISFISFISLFLFAAVILFTERERELLWPFSFSP